MKPVNRCFFSFTLSSGATSNSLFAFATQYIALYTRLNDFVDHRMISNLEKRNIFFVSVQFMMMKRPQNITLDVLLPEEKEASEDKYRKTEKRSCLV